MRMTYIGQAGLVIEAAGATIVCDPWLSVHGAFNAGWFQLPANQHLLPWLQARKIDYLYLSHSHLDHFDEETLAALPKDATLLVAAFPSKPWRKLVQGLGFARVEFLKTFEERELAPGLRATIVHAPTPFAHDSALILEDVRSGQVIVNLNDCKIDEAQQQRIRGRHPRIAAVLAQFSGATWFPFVYDFPEAERVAAARQKNRNGMRRWRGYMRALAPEWTVPFAGPPAILDPQTGRYMRGPDTIFTTPPDLMEFLLEEEPEIAASTPLLLPGDALDFDREEVIEDAAAHAAFSWQQLDDYIPGYAEQMRPYVAEAIARYPVPGEPLYPAFKAYFELLFAAAPRFSIAVDARVLFEVEGCGGGRWLADFREQTVADFSDDPRPREQLCDYSFRLESRYMQALIGYRLRWDDFMLSFRFRAWRPSVAAYNENLITFLRFAHPDELKVQDMLLSKASALYQSTSFTLQTAGGAYAVQQFCPHMGEKLSQSCYDAERGVLVCPRHGWTFAVPGGECQNARARVRIAPVAADMAAQQPGGGTAHGRDPAGGDRHGHDALPHGSAPGLVGGDVSGQ